MKKIETILNSNFRINLLRGKIVENIIKFMLEDLGFRVLPNGYENYFNEIVMRNVKLIGSKDVISNIRKLPDFVIIDKDKKAYFVEIKYRKNSSLSEEQICKYPHTYIICYEEGYIKCYYYDYKDIIEDYLTEYDLFKNRDELIVNTYIDYLNNLFS
jgi:hypothetical protein